MDDKKEIMPKLEEAAESVVKRKNLLVENIRSKSMIEEYLQGKISKEEMAYTLAEDKELRRVTENVVEGIINPEPTKALKEERDPVGIDVGYGLSIFWQSINTPIDQKVSAAADVREVLGQVSVATDLSEAPNIREEIYKDLGLDEEQIDTLIPESEKVEYTRALEDHYRDEHMERLNLKDGDMMDIADEERIAHLVEDSMAMVHSGHDQIPPNFSYGQEPMNGYMEEYGMTPEELNRAYADAQGDDVYDYPPYEEMYDLANYPTMNTAIKNVEAVYSGSLEDNMTHLSELESLESSLSEVDMSDDDLQDLNDEYLEHLVNSEPPSLSDDDLMGLEMDNEDIQR